MDNQNSAAKLAACDGKLSMKLVEHFARRLRGVARYLEKPELWKVRQCDVDVSIFEHLSQRWLLHQNIATVLDIGANEGQFALAVRHAMPQAKVYSFEPLPDCFENLSTKMRGQTNFKALNIGLGDQKGSLSFERNSFTASSSFLKMSETHKSAFPQTRDSRTVQVQIERLDEIASQLELADPMLIKLDVQGYEDRVLRGGEKTVKRAKIIITETSFETLYEGQVLFDQIYSLLKEWGFHYVGAFNQMAHPETGKLLQADSIFIKNE